MSPLLHQLSKGTEIAMHSVTLLVKENQELRYANTKAIRNRTTEVLTYEGALTLSRKVRNVFQSWSYKSR
jgi:hypothetical protein